MPDLMFFSALALTAILFALVEIQIEGPHGWAAQLPTWRVQNKWTRWFYSCRPLTGYHLFTQSFVLTIVHLPFLLSLARFSWHAELRVLSFMVLFWIAEDFLWFVLNPAYGLRKFRSRHIWWHQPTWWWIMPRDYWLFLPVGIALYVLSR